MKRFEITCAAVLVCLFMGNSVLAQEEKQGRSVTAPAFGSSRSGDSTDLKKINVRVHNDGEQITIDASFIVPVAPQQAWAVLTDFDNIPNFNSGILSSKVISRTGNRVQVSQKAATKYGFLTFSYDSTREIDLVPFSKIQERMTHRPHAKIGRDDTAISRRRAYAHHIQRGFDSRQLDPSHGGKCFYKA